LLLKYIWTLYVILYSSAAGQEWPGKSSGSFLARYKTGSLEQRTAKDFH